jgi:hypothetical protein
LTIRTAPPCSWRRVTAGTNLDNEIPMDMLSAHRMFDFCKPCYQGKHGETDGTKCPSCGHQDVTVIGVHTTQDKLTTTLTIRGLCGHEWVLMFGRRGSSTLACLMVSIDEDDEPLEYSEYIASAEWRAKAEAAKERCGQRCQTCNVHRSKTTLDAHHRTYERIGEELPEDLIVLCRDCHSLFHKNRRLARSQA